LTPAGRTGRDSARGCLRSDRHKRFPSLFRFLSRLSPRPRLTDSYG
jgi:hypothetical protein